ncbi:hypothetical protein CIT292_06199 [Citrobacter youngae ATCC 29220]|uniref:Uncharacterized protein n=1 Tax=Citrobacter youngae ATCC 29220 TaxID=500640 RepID=D4B7A3_9ENTR|nr:hypothetical protein CIT292_06199 [Citrobacter youngae ATCC 29220]
MNKRNNSLSTLYNNRDAHRNIATRKGHIFSCWMILTNGKHVNFVNLKKVNEQ